MFIKSNDGIRIYYSIKKGTGRPLLLLHGLAVSSDSFKEVVRDITRPMISIDFRGHGRSDKPSNRSYYSLEKCVDDVRLIISKERIKSFDVIGFSMGGYVASRIANELKGAKKVVLINPVFGRNSVRISFIVKAVASLFVPRLLLRPFVRDERVWVYKGLLDEYAKLLLVTPRRTYLNLMLNSLQLKTVNPPSNASIIASSKDEIVNSKVFTHKVNGHHYVLAENPAEVASLFAKIFPRL